MRRGMDKWDGRTNKTQKGYRRVPKETETQMGRRMGLGVLVRKMGMFGFWNGSYKKGSFRLAVRIVHGGWEVIHKTCAPVFGRSALDAEVKGCGLSVERMMSWVKNVKP